VDSEKLAALGIDAKWLEPMLETFEKYDISTPERQAAFIGQCAHESGNFKYLEENLNYSAERLCAVWPSRFPNLEAAAPYHRNPEAIANKVYSGRMGNGPEDSGEGFAFRGRGVVQLTGRDNYQRCGDGLGVDLVGNPDLLKEPKYAMLSAGWFWNKTNLNALADSGDLETMTRRINGGLNGLNDRLKHIAHAQEVLTA
jgi:putative chitinase